MSSGGGEIDGNVKVVAGMLDILMVENMAQKYRAASIEALKICPTQVEEGRKVRAF